MGQRLLADLVGVMQSTIYNWESESSCLDGEEIRKLAEVLEIPVSALFTETALIKAVQQTNHNSPVHLSGKLVHYEELHSV